MGEAFAQRWNGSMLVDEAVPPDQHLRRRYYLDVRPAEAQGFEENVRIFCVGAQIQRTYGRNHLPVIIIGDWVLDTREVLERLLVRTRDEFAAALADVRREVLNYDHIDDNERHPS